MNWLDKFGFLSLNPAEPYANTEDNGVEFSVILGMIQKNCLPTSNAVMQLEVGHSLIQRPDKPLDPSSHDNTTAIMSWSRKCKHDFHKRIRIFPEYIHPRDIVYYAWMRRNWYDWWSFFFLWVTSVCCIESCFNMNKTDRITGQKLISTDGKILTYIRCFHHMPITWWICKHILEWRFNSDAPMHEIFKVYFKNPSHPIILWSKGHV